MRLSSRPCRALKIGVRSFATSRRRTLQQIAIEKCPEPTCPCASTPPLPVGVEPIDTASQLAGTVAIHNRLVVVGTGADSGEHWPSKIEIEGKGVGADIIKKIKSEMGVKGRYFSSYWNGMIVASSFGGKDMHPSLPPQAASAIVLPQSVQVSPLSPAAASDFIEDLVLPSSDELQKSLGRRQLAVEEQAKLPLRNPQLSDAATFQKRDITGVVVFVCGHGQRDGRCGVLGPLLKDEFEQKLFESGMQLSREPATSNHGVDSSPGERSATVGLISHIGGHKFAGNVIIHIPRNIEHNRLAGKTIWYGRVEPRHVDGIVKKTIHEGVVIRELLRGGMDETGAMLDIGLFMNDA